MIKEDYAFNNSEGLFDPCDAAAQGPILYRRFFAFLFC